MTNEAVLKTLWQIRNLLSGNMTMEEASESAAILFFAKRITDCANQSPVPLWLHGYSRLVTSIAGFKWDYFSASDASAKLTRLFHEIERAIPGLQGLWQSKIATAAEVDQVRTVLPPIFDTLRNIHCSKLTTRDAGFIFETVVEAAAIAGDRSFTPVSVRKLIVRVVNPQPGDTIYDPVCRSGSLLWHAADSGSDDVPLQLFGQDVRHLPRALAHEGEHRMADSLRPA